MLTTTKTLKTHALKRQRVVLMIQREIDRAGWTHERQARLTKAREQLQLAIHALRG